MASNQSGKGGRPRVSIIVTSYNYARFIGETIRSVIDQTLDSWELIIVDDCSTDDSWNVIQAYQDPRIHAVRFDKNRGACAAYNTALSLASGEFIASLDSDDVFAANKLAVQVDFLDQHPEVDICGTYLEEIDDAGNTVPSENCLYAPWFNKELDLNSPDCWIWENHLCHSGVLMRKSLHDRVGSFREELTYSPDWNFWLRALAEGATFHVMPQELVRYRSHGSNITHRNFDALMWEYADTSARTLHPYLVRAGRPDLIAKNVQIFVKRFFEVDGDWRRYLELMDLLDWRNAHGDRFAIPSHLFDDPELTALVARLARGWSPQMVADMLPQSLEHAAEGSDTEQATALPAADASTFLLLVRNERDQARRDLADAGEAVRSGVEREARLESEQTALKAEQKRLQAEIASLRTELDRIGGTVWGKADRLYRRLGGRI
ncbi:glycosyltransferase [Burkholderia contaminans]|uniref:glycosyltransferase n=1 Tax=Burkholderia contaminans TaxID=488447 RepID=UPI000F571E44|nr:glycosyltransferase [Burkholderia contaminans]MCA8157139.1 glycosyltransferase [Burkholderia contaminans]RQT07184.1 glycosyltransferase [Burkholderia contaminans]RQT17571.1 glycosyltransferase [Burkholderia contaminans]VWC71169.1 glycosyltransferase [Burkholderia contaminans]VWD03640.1 glycosyltransferase [Burkholderia contaminans]